MDKRSIPNTPEDSPVSSQLLPHRKCAHSLGFQYRSDVSIIFYVTGIILYIFLFEFFWGVWPFLLSVYLWDSSVFYICLWIIYFHCQSTFLCVNKRYIYHSIINGHQRSVQIGVLKILLWTFYYMIFDEQMYWFLLVYTQE